jgi:hypothetical protein
MAFAEGAWWLLGADSASSTGSLRRQLTQLFNNLRIGQHDIDRRGDKGFTRIERGFATTPTSVAMRQHFLRHGDPETAALFRPSSMEFVQALGTSPLVMVSEIPLFAIRGGGVLADPPGESTPYTRFRDRFAEARLKLARGNSVPLEDLLRDFAVEPVPFDTQCKAIGAGVLAAVDHLLGRHEA